jgi:hypothetical protein
MSQPEPIRKQSLLSLDAAHITVGLGALYSVGFVVANAHFGRYALINVEILRARYISAALLFVACSSIPTAVGMFLSTSLRRSAADGKLYTDRPIGDSEAWAMGPKAFFGLILIGLGLYLVIISLISTKDFGIVVSWIVYFIAAALVASQLSDLLLGGTGAVEATLWPTFRLPFRVLYLTCWVIVLPAIFSTLVYGSIKPELGGGAIWKARLSWSQEADSASMAVASGTVAIVDKRAGSLEVLACSDTLEPRKLSLSSASISFIQLGSVVLPSNFIHNHATECQRLASTTFPSNAARLLALSVIILAALGVLIRRLLKHRRRETA